MTNTKRLKLKQERIEFDRSDWEKINPLGVLVNKRMDALVGGLSIIDDCDYVRIKSNVALTESEIMEVADSVEGVTDAKYLNPYTFQFSIDKDGYFKADGDDGVINNIFATLHEVFNHRKCHAGTCNCAEQQQLEVYDLIMDAINETKLQLNQPLHAKLLISTQQAI